jgi:hypothetical protein
VTTRKLPHACTCIYKGHTRRADEDGRGFSWTIGLKAAYHVTHPRAHPTHPTLSPTQPSRAPTLLPTLQATTTPSLPPTLPPTVTPTVRPPQVIRSRPCVL